ncbi:hypothetical protein D1610_07660 [Sphingomonas gilva]|uniref:Uncharacterized protein n=1 Tax=Sphingomonas gilva TaxID=2305907 RepID=A0A396RP84_9SPHN|nr:hypothetical protein [Sphingomonas gilva]RHW18330.1 hypothetical protein D1610_07660 [Sphingomonas gilva]
MIVIAALAALAACAQEHRADTGNATEAVIAAEADTVTADNLAAMPTPLAAGSWTYAESARAAWFGEPDAEARFSIACDQRAGRLIFTRGAEARPGDAMTIVTPSATRELPIAPATDAATMPEASASISAADPWLDQLARADDAITVRVGTGEPLALPADPAIGRAIAACKP